MPEGRTSENLKACTYYVVKVMFFKGNFEHKAIFYHHNNGYGKLLSGGYEQEHRIKYDDFYHIEIIEEIKAMN